MKDKTKGFIAGIITAIMVVAILGTAIGVAADQLTKTVQIAYNNIKICIDGTFIEPKDANGNTVEPFALDGTTYLPVRAVASALGKEVEWDGETSTVYLGKRPAAGAGNGTRSNPYSADAGITVPYNEYSFKPTRQIQAKCIKIITGEAANYIVSKENPYNDVPTSNQEWKLFEMELTYISSSDGEDDVLSASDVIYTNLFFKPDGSALNSHDSATLGDIYGGYGVFDVKLYPGGSSKVVVGILTDKYDGDILLKVPYDKGSKNNWIRCNTGDNVIRSIDEVNNYLGLLKQESVDNSPVKLKLRNSLPTSIGESSSSGSPLASATITDFTYSVSGSRVSITFTGEKTFDSNGNGYSRPVKVGWKLYDAEGYVVDDGVANSTSIKVGEKFKNCEDTIYSLEPGEYELEIMGVR